MKNRFAMMIRIITAPPLMAAAFILVVAYCRQDVFTSISRLLTILTCLVFIPLLAYPLSAVLPPLRAKGREGQRKFAFVMTAVGYPLLGLYAVIAGVEPAFALISLCYILSFLFLLLCNKGLRLKASGHACAVTGPLILSGWFLGLYAAVAAAVIYAVSIWASLATKRHTLKELLLGTGCCLLAFIASLMFFSFQGLT